MNTSFKDRYSSLKQSQKPARGVPAYTLYVNRPVGRLIAALCPVMISANGLTVMSSFVSALALLMLWLVAPGSPFLSLAGILLIFGYFLDSADGQLARLRNTRSFFGDWLDHVLDSGRMVFVHITVVAFIYRTDPSLIKFSICAIYLVSAMLIYVGGLLAGRDPALIRESALYSTPLAFVRSLALLPVDYGLLCVLFLFLPWTSSFVNGYFVLASFSALYAVIYLAKWTRELRRV